MRPQALPACALGKIRGSDGVADRNLAYCDQGIDKYPNGSMSISLETDYGFAYRR